MGYILALLILLIPSAGWCGNVTYYTYGGAEAIYNALHSLSLILNGSNTDYKNLLFLLAVSGIFFGFIFWVVSGGGNKGLFGGIVKILAAFVLTIGLVVKAPKDNVQVYDPSLNQTFTVYDVPIIITIPLRILGVIERTVVNIVETNSPNPAIPTYSQTGGGNVFKILYSLLNQDVFEAHPYIRANLKTFTEDCVSYEITRATDLTPQDFTTSTIYNIINKSMNPWIITKEYSSTSTEPITSNCNSLGNVIKTQLQNTAVFDPMYTKTAQEAGKVTVSSIKTSVDTITSYLSNGAISNSTLSFLRMGAAQVIKETIEEGDDLKLAATLAGQSSGTSMLSTGLVLSDWLPSIRGWAIAMALSVLPVVLLFIITPLWMRAIQFIFGIFIWLTIWNIIDAIMYTQGMSMAYSFFEKIRLYDVNSMRSLLTFPDETAKTVAMFAGMRTAALTLASIISMMITRFGGVAVAQLTGSMMGTVSSAGGQQAGLATYGGHAQATSVHSTEGAFARLGYASSEVGSRIAHAEAVKKMGAMYGSVFTNTEIAKGASLYESALGAGKTVAFASGNLNTAGSAGAWEGQYKVGEQKAAGDAYQENLSLAKEAGAISSASGISKSRALLGEVMRKKYLNDKHFSQFNAEGQNRIIDDIINNKTGKNASLEKQMYDTIIAAKSGNKTAQDNLIRMAKTLNPQKDYAWRENADAVVSDAMFAHNTFTETAKKLGISDEELKGKSGEEIKGLISDKISKQEEKLLSDKYPAIKNMTTEEKQSLSGFLSADENDKKRALIGLALNRSLDNTLSKSSIDSGSLSVLKKAGGTAGLVGGISMLSSALKKQDTSRSAEEKNLISQIGGEEAAKKLYSNIDNEISKNEDKSEIAGLKKGLGVEHIADSYSSVTQSLNQYGRGAEMAEKSGMYHVKAGTKNLTDDEVKSVSYNELSKSLGQSINNVPVSTSAKRSFGPNTTVAGALSAYNTFLKDPVKHQKDIKKYGGLEQVKKDRDTLLSSITPENKALLSYLGGGEINKGLSEFNKISNNEEVKNAAQNIGESIRSQALTSAIATGAGLMVASQSPIGSVSGLDGRVTGALGGATTVSQAIGRLESALSGGDKKLLNAVGGQAVASKALETLREYQENTTAPTNINTNANKDWQSQLKASPQQQQFLSQFNSLPEAAAAISNILKNPQASSQLKLLGGRKNAQKLLNDIKNKQNQDEIQQTAQQALSNSGIEPSETNKLKEIPTFSYFSHAPNKDIENLKNISGIINKQAESVGAIGDTQISTDKYGITTKDATSFFGDKAKSEAYNISTQDYHTRQAEKVSQILGVGNDEGWNLIKNKSAITSEQAAVAMSKGMNAFMADTKIDSINTDRAGNIKQIKTEGVVTDKNKDAIVSSLIAMGVDQNTALSSVRIGDNFSYTGDATGRTGAITLKSGVDGKHQLSFNNTLGNTTLKTTNMGDLKIASGVITEEGGGYTKLRGIDQSGKGIEAVMQKNADGSYTVTKATSESWARGIQAMKSSEIKKQDWYKQLEGEEKKQVDKYLASKKGDDAVYIQTLSTSDGKLAQLSLADSVDIDGSVSRNQGVRVNTLRSSVSGSKSDHYSGVTNYEKGNSVKIGNEPSINTEKSVAEFVNEVKGGVDPQIAMGKLLSNVFNQQGQNILDNKTRQAAINKIVDDITKQLSISNSFDVTSIRSVQAAAGARAGVSGGIGSGGLGVGGGGNIAAEYRGSGAKASSERVKYSDFESVLRGSLSQSAMAAANTYSAMIKQSKGEQTISQKQAFEKARVAFKDTFKATEGSKLLESAGDILKTNQETLQNAFFAGPGQQARK